jgi:hypothetical protein
MKVTFNLDNGANIHSCKSVTFNLNTEKGQKSLGYTKEEWVRFTDVEKNEICHEWANNHIEIYYEEAIAELKKDLGIE